MLRKIFFCAFFSVAAAAAGAQGLARESAAAEAAEARPAAVSSSGLNIELRRLRADAQEAVARLDGLRAIRDKSDGTARAEIEARVDAEYANIDRMRRELAGLLVRADSEALSRRLEFDRQRRVFNGNNSTVHNRIMEQQQRLNRQRIQEQRRMHAMNR